MNTADTEHLPNDPAGRTRTRPGQRPEPDPARMIDGVPGFEILDWLGRGGMGVVYLARQTRLNRTVALKMILGGDHADPADVVRFLGEGEALAALSHPNVVQVFEAGTIGTLPYLALEYVPGGSLETHVRPAPLAPDRAARLVAAVARGMAYAHARGIAHRDLKPDNILLADDDTPKIVDFGLAKWFRTGAGPTKVRAVLGTVSYMAPEQARGDVEAVGPAADVWALGAVLYRVLAGRPPFQAATEELTIDQILRSEPVSPRTIQPAVPRDLETIALTCLQKEPARRYPSAGALADDLDRFLAGRPIVARPIGPAAKAWRWARRNPSVAGLAAALAVIITGAVLGMTVLWQQATDRARAAQAAEAEADRLLRVAEDERSKAEAARWTALAEAEHARAEEARAVAAKRNTEAAVAFLGGLFEAVDPVQVTGVAALVSRERGWSPTARDLLARGVQLLDDLPHLDPEVRALLLSRIGHSFLSLGELPAADRHLTRARDLLAAQSAAHPGLVGAHHGLAWLEQLRGNYLVARGHYQEAIRRQQACPPSPDQKHGLTAIQLQYATLLADLEEEGALAMARDALKARVELYGDQDLRVAEAHLGCAAVALELGDGLAVGFHSAVGQGILQKAKPNDTLAKAMGLFQAGVLEARSKDKTEAGLAKLREAVRLAEEKLTARNQYSLLTKAQLGLEEYGARQYDRAEVTLTACFQTTRELNLLTHPKAAMLVLALCDILTGRGKSAVGRAAGRAAARAVVAEWLAAHRAVNSDGLPHADALAGAARVSRWLGDPAEERHRLDAALALYRKQPPELKRSWHVQALFALGRHHARAGAWTAAAAAFRDGLGKADAWYGAKFDPDDWGSVTAELARTVFRGGDDPSQVKTELDAALARKPTGRGWVQVTLRLAEYYRATGDGPAALRAARGGAARARHRDDLVDAAEQLVLGTAAGPADGRAAVLDQAAQALLKAARAGYRDAAAVEAVSAFRALAERPDYREALAIMRMKK